MNHGNVTLETIQRWFEEGKNDVIVEALSGKQTELTPRESFYLASALIHQDDDATARHCLSKALLIAEGVEKADLLALSAFVAAKRGDDDAYLRLAQEAAELHATPHTLYHFGLALPDSSEGIPILQGALLAAEEAADGYAEGRNAYALAISYSWLGDYKEALSWSRFAYARTAHPLHRILSLNTRAYTRILAESTAGLEVLLKEALEEAAGTSYKLQRKQLMTTLADLYQAEGRYDEALALYEAELDKAPRMMWAVLAHGCVRALRALGRQEEAEAIAETAVSVSQTLSSYYRDYATLVLGIALWPSEEAVGLLEGVYPNLTEKVLATEAAFYLAAAELMGKEVQGSFTSAARDMKQQLTTTGVRFLAGDAHEHLEPIMTEKRPVRAHLLGAVEVYKQGHFVRVRQRSVELLALLLQEPRGYTAEALSEALYGTLQLSALRVELHRLRKDLGLTVHTHPYRLGDSVWADVLEVGKALNEGRTCDAVALYRGPLLPSSKAPGVVELRQGLEAELHGAALAKGDTAEPPKEQALTSHGKIVP